MVSSNDLIKHGTPLTELILKNRSTLLRKPYLKLRETTPSKWCDCIRKIPVLWKIMNRALPFKIKARQICSKDLKSVANEFNQFFAAVGRNAAEASVRLAKKNNIAIPEEISVDLTPIDEPFNLRTVTREDVRQVTLFLPLNKAPSPDIMNTRISNDFLPFILGPLTEIINCSILTSSFLNK